MRATARPQPAVVAGTHGVAAGRLGGAAACQPRVLRPRQAARTDRMQMGASPQDEAPPAASAQERGAADAVQPAPSGSQGADVACDDTVEYLQHCQASYGKPGLVEFTEGAGGLPKAVLMHPSGARCEVYLHGAAVTSWRHEDGREMLHVREGNAYNGEQPINGGIQLSWPQYGAGPLPTHGFLQNLHWSVVETAWREPSPEDVGREGAADWRPSISLYAESDDDLAEVWPHKFVALYTVCLSQPDPKEPSDLEFMREATEKLQPWVQRQQAAKAAAGRKGGGEDTVRRGWAGGGGGWEAEEARPPLTPSVLRCILQVHNTDDSPFTFTTGLRTHFATRDIPTHSKFVKTLGLRGKYELDYSTNPFEPRLGVADDHYVYFDGRGEQNSVFSDCGPGGDVLFCPGSASHFNVQNKQGFDDIGVVHPAAVAPAEARRFVQIASARAVREVTLQPGETWVGEMSLAAHDAYWPLPAWEMEDSSGVPIPDQDIEQMPTLRRRSNTADVALLENQGI